ncbi:Transcriptional regulator GlxA family, contains an amidase domain and an AraC-type DNA-binding HTH domain [Paracoccus homiensis]|uniref:Transcriptional regulator GlxA family, contains an amidase domain and an AraC-type DNA-binding HTH domain n=1 Tax=Paracoccus homiensis TaxID=364199 RepID=A0A1I0HF95_9RHOB|nr:Transcriptional regulator GlxA family, contains an amidase domain and an AraC-type DNA-binding HTH domain [Paracoccus homiensis]
MQRWAIIVQIWKSSETCRSIGVLLFDDFSNHCLANAIEPFRAANTMARKQLYRWQFLSLDGAAVVSSSGLPVHPGAALARHPGGDYLFVMPSYGFQAHATPACARGLRAARRRFRTLVGMDTGSWLLADAGLLEGRRATIHWDELGNLAETYPGTRVTDDRMVDDGDILTCGGVTTTFDLALHLIEAHHGAMLRLEVASLFMHGEAAAPLPGPSQMPRNRKAEAAVALMRRNIETPLPIPDIARQIGLSAKALSQICQQRHGLGAAQLYQAIRLREARRLIEQTGFGIEEIAGRCGYQNASAMTRAFHREFATTPRDLRRSGP